MAGESLTTMAVSLNSNWKVPLGYFLIKDLNASGKVFRKIHDILIKKQTKLFHQTF